ncbi:uncharacterized protein LOC122853227 isoform X2 [Aphidius gifuensis]|uniref:uncharacterized protein LOC122853227 isoform X2 n=1 Tax=Aphidius gifuensis TaxID=684658 RepID=UPI001CDBE576|nr:uncharacterized protein LOC122853227 isoform X2 [Aphidius gifuensis]
MDPQNNSRCLQMQQMQNNPDNGLCQTTLLPADSIYVHHQQQHHNNINEDETTASTTTTTTMHSENRNRCQSKIDNQQKYRRNKERHIEGRSLSPASSSDNNEIFTTTSRQQSHRHRQHSSHRHKHLNNKNNNSDNIYQDNRIENHQQHQQHQHSTGLNMHQVNYCHGYHEIGPTTSCYSDVCNSDIHNTIEDNKNSFTPSNYQDRYSVFDDDIYGQMSSQPTSVTETIISSRISPSSSNVIGPLQIQNITNEHQRISSGVSCESSLSSASNKHHERCMTEQRRNHPRHNNNFVQSYTLNHPQRTIRENENNSPLLIGLESIQMNAPAKKKCTCHMEHTQQQLQLQHQQHHQQQQQQSLQNDNDIQRQQAVRQTNHYSSYIEHGQFDNLEKRQHGNDDGSNVITSSSRIRQPPALPPRPPTRPNRQYETTAYDRCADNGEGGCCKKYVVLCCLCGGLSAAVGSLFLAVHAVLSAHTASLMHFETVPSYIPGFMLIMMGLFTILLARRKLRYGILMKICGSVGVVCALICVLVTVTTTVIHMSKLQSLRECVYTARARSCTCYGALQGRGNSDTGVLFEGIPHCEAVHGALYACLRALFGISVAGILACIFSCMLVYQLLSHEKKKMYWEQLELRCRSLYGQGTGAPVGNASVGSCGCCNDCGNLNPWWAQTPGNLYTPNPDIAPSRWRLPWSRSRGPAPTPDSNYGFNAQSMRHANVDDNDPSHGSTINVQTPYGFMDSHHHHQSGPYSVLNTHSQSTSYTPNTASYSVLETRVPLWGPPPPYSDPNSPARQPQINEHKNCSSMDSSSASSVVVMMSTTRGASSLTQTLPTSSRLAAIKNHADNFESTNEGNNIRTVTQNFGYSENYENSEELLNNAKLEAGINNGNTINKLRRQKKTLKGVENDAFQQDNKFLQAANQLEIDKIYFDNNSCCNGLDNSTNKIDHDNDEEVSIKEHQEENMEQSSYTSSPIDKIYHTKRSRLPLPLPPQQNSTCHNDVSIESTCEQNYMNSNEAMSLPEEFLAPDAQYDLIQQGNCYGYCPAKNINESRENLSNYSFKDISNRDFKSKDNVYEKKSSQSSSEALDDNLIKQNEEEHQCCSNSSVDLEADWKNLEQKLKSEKGVCPINV